MAAPVRLIAAARGGPTPSFVKLSPAQARHLEFSVVPATVEACTQDVVATTSNVKATITKGAPGVRHERGTATHQHRTDVQLRARHADGSSETFRWSHPGTRHAVVREGDAIEVWRVRGGFDPPLHSTDRCYREATSAYLVLAGGEVQPVAPLPALAAPRNILEAGVALTGLFLLVAVGAVLFMAIRLTKNPASLLEVDAVTSFATGLGITSVCLLGSTVTAWLGIYGPASYRLRKAQWKELVESS